LSVSVKTPLWAWLLLLLWCAATFGWLWQQQKDYYGVFDPQRQLSMLPSQLPAALNRSLAAQSVLFSTVTPAVATETLSGGAAEQLIVVLAADCYCTGAARRHLSELQQRSRRRIAEITPQQLALAGIQVPATPALLWWRDQQLWYAGPLATGAVCGTAGDLLLPLLTGQQQLAGSWRNSDTQACRCLQTVQR
jgi:hypothetical protein